MREAHCTSRGVGRLGSYSMNLKKAELARKGGASPCLKETNRDVRVKALVRRFSRGNVNLQIGRYASKKEIAERREQLAEFDFAD